MPIDVRKKKVQTSGCVILPGFYIRKYDSGKQSYVVKYSLASGKQRKLSLGAAAPGRESEARKEASTILLKGEGWTGYRWRKASHSDEAINLGQKLNH